MKTFLSFALLFCTLLSEAQSENYLQDLKSLRSILLKTPSYKAQIKGDKLREYNTLYNRLIRDTVSNPLDYKYFYNLTQLLFPLRDNHLGFYQLANYNNFNNKENIDRFVASGEFAQYEKLSLDIDSLKTVLAKKPVDSIEGIYHYHSYYSVGLFKITGNEYVGVITDSKVNFWTRGQVAMHLYQQEPNLYKAIYAHPVTKNLILYANEKYSNQSLANSFFYNTKTQAVYSKQISPADYVNLPQNSPHFAFRNINNKVQYMLIKTFQRYDAMEKKSNAFSDSIKNLVTAPNLIVDLRNNEGGAKKLSQPYFKMLRRYSKRGKIYLLLNNETLSRAEILTLQLMKLKNVTTIGQTTKGKLSYGSNEGKRITLPSGKFQIYITDMGGSKKLLQYEDYGIKPQIILNKNTDWIEQVVLLINRQ